MGRKRFTTEQIITLLREAEVLLSQGAQITEVWHKLGVSGQTLLPLAERLRRDEGGPGQAAQKARAGFPRDHETSGLPGLTINGCMGRIMPLAETSACPKWRMPEEAGGADK